MRACVKPFLFSVKVNSKAKTSFWWENPAVITEIEKFPEYLQTKQSKQFRINVINYNVDGEWWIIKYFNESLSSSSHLHHFIIRILPYFYLMKFRNVVELIACNWICIRVSIVLPHNWKLLYFNWKLREHACVCLCELHPQLKCINICLLSWLLMRSTSRHFPLQPADNQL